MSNGNRKIRTGLVGVGNCAAALLEGIQWYAENPGETKGLLSPDIDGYKIGDIDVVMAFDVDVRKVGLTIGEAAEFNERRLAKPLNFPGPVMPSPRLDGLASTSIVETTDDMTASVEDIAHELRMQNLDVLVNYLPVGSTLASELYALAAAEAGVAFLNCIPVEIARNATIAERFALLNVPLIGDDIKSQYGATILHRSLVRICAERGVHLESTYQLNVGGNADFRNMLDQSRLTDKRISKTTSVTDVYPVDKVHIGPSDYVDHLDDTKIAFINLDMVGFAGSPMSVDLKLEVIDSPNSAGIVVDGIRYLAVAKNRGIGGVLDAPSGFLMKAPQNHTNDDLGAKRAAVAFLSDE